MKTPRPDIPKLDIDKIGTFDDKGQPYNWSFNGRSKPNSVGVCVRDEWVLYGGYTVEELVDIKAKSMIKTNIKMSEDLPIDAKANGGIWKEDEFNTEPLIFKGLDAECVRVFRDPDGNFRAKLGEPVSSYDGVIIEADK